MSIAYFFFFVDHVAKQAQMLYSKDVVKPKEKQLFHKQNPFATIATALLLCSVGTFGFLSSSVVFAFTEAPANTSPGTYPTTALPNLKFLNGSTAAQQKKGSLVVGSTGGTSALCLNSNTTVGIYDSANCVTSWTQAAAQASSSTQLGYGSLSGTTGTQFADYIRQVGFVRLKNDNDTVGVNKNQRHALIVEANSSAPSSAIAVGLYAAEGPIGAGVFSSNWAGYFSGNVSLYDEFSTSNKTFCLNGTDDVVAGSSTGCIRRWVDYVFGATGISYLALNPSSAEPGRVAATGTFMSSTVQVGSIAGMPLSWTCGDGMCSTNTNPAETTANCPVDCSAIGGAPTMSLWSGNTRAYIDVTNGTQSNLVILRKAGSYPSAIPLDGVQYAAGDSIGDALVVYATSSATTNMVIPTVTDSGLTNGTAYYYQVYQGNAYPRYVLGVQNFVTPSTYTYLLSLNYTGSPSPTTSIGYQVIHGEASLSSASCNNGCGFRFTPGSVVQVLFSANVTNFDNWSGACSGATPTCTVTMTATGISVTGVFPAAPPPDGDGGGQIDG